MSGHGPAAARRVGLVVVSHVPAIAEGTATLLAQMAPDVVVATAGGTDDGEVGTSFDLVLAALEKAEQGAGAVVLYDLGSALLTTESALELLDDDRRDRVRVVDAPLVEGALAAAVTAQGGADLADVARSASRAGGSAEDAGAPAGSVAAAAPAAPAGPPDAHEERRTLRLENPLGLHARPAALLARALAGVDAVVRLARPGGQPVETGSLLGVVGLALRGGDEVAVSATGPDALRALDLVADLVAGGFGEGQGGAAGEAPGPGTSSVEDAVSPRIRGTSTATVGDTRTYVGVPVSPGTAAGRIRHLRPAEVTLPDAAAEAERDPARERRRLNDALERVAARLADGGGELAAAHALLVTDPALQAPATSAIEAGASAERGWWEAVQAARARLAAGGDEIVAGRAVDVLDVGLQVLGDLDPALVRSAVPDSADLRGAIIVAEDVLPSHIPLLAGAAAGLVTAGGARTAHASLLARGVGLPMVVAVGPAVTALPEGAPAVLDAGAGRIVAPATDDEVAAASTTGEQERAARAAEAAAAHEPVVLPDGRRLAVAANVGSAEEAHVARESGADGIGLLRTELLFLDRPTLPGEDEQVAGLHEILAALPGRPVVVRTLDVGGDKDLPALHLDPRRNGFLGERGLRHGLAHPEVLRTQVRAVLRAAATHHGEVALMAPMVTFADEVAAFRDVVAAAARELADEGTPHRLPDAVGIMLEVPAAALAASEVAAGLDFVSVGTNDLVQYLTAAERTLPEVASLYRPDSTAVWRALELIVEGAHARGARVTVCGEMASDPASARRLVELGVDELSVAPRSVPAVKAALRPVATD